MAKIPTARLIYLVDTRVEITPEFCWAWTGSKWSNGYASLKINGSNHLGHRVFYETLRSEIPDGLVVDHLCKNRRCVNPEHMELVTRGENTRRGRTGWLAENCLRGHPLTPDNVYTRTDGTRRCKFCTRRRDNAASQLTAARAKGI